MNDDYIRGLQQLCSFNGIDTDSIDEEIIENIFKCPNDVYHDDDGDGHDDDVRDGASMNTFHQQSSDEHTTSVEEKIFLVEKKKKLTLKDKFNKYRQIALQRKKHRVECSNSNSNNSNSNNNMKDIIDKKILKKESNRIAAQKSRDKKKEEYKYLIQENTLLKHKITMMYNIMINCTQCKQHICSNNNDIAVNNDTIEIQTPTLTTTTTTSIKHCSRKQIAIFTGGMISTIAILCIMSLCSNTNNIYVNNNNNTNNNIRALHNNYYVHKYANYTNVDESLYYTNINNNNNDNTNEIDFYVDYYANSNNNNNKNDDWSYYIENKANVINTQDGILYNSSLPVIYQSALDRDEIWTEIEKNALLFLVKDPIWILSLNITNVIKNIDDGQEYKPISGMIYLLSETDNIKNIYEVDIHVDIKKLLL